MHHLSPAIINNQTIVQSDKEKMANFSVSFNPTNATMEPEVKGERFISFYLA